MADGQERASLLPKDRSLLSSPNRRNKLARRPISEHVAASSSSIPGQGRRSGGRGVAAKAALSSDEEEPDPEEKDDEYLTSDEEEISSVGQDVGAGAGVNGGVASENSPPSAGFQHSSPMLSPVVRLKDCRPRRTSAKATKAKPTLPPPTTKDSSGKKFQNGGHKKGDKESQESTEDSDGYKSHEVIKKRKLSKSLVLPEEFMKRGKSVKYTSEAENVEKSSYWGTMFIILLLLGLVGIGLHFRTFRLDKFEEEADEEAFDAKRMRDNLKEMFPNQSNRTWRVITSQYNRVFGKGAKSSNQPACIVVVSSETTKSAAQCFAAALANTVAKVKPMTSKNFNLETLEKNMLESKAAVVYDIDLIGGGVGMKLHPYCDSVDVEGLNPYVNSALVSTVALKNLGSGNPERDAGAAISEQWEKTVSRDKVSSVISRVVLSAVQFNEISSNQEFTDFCANFDVSLG